MEKFLINGSKQEIPNDLGKGSPLSLSRLLEYLREKHSSAARMISSVAIDGQEVWDRDSLDLEARTVGEVNTVEVRTCTPIEFAQETLQTLVAYTQELENLSTQTAESFKGDRKSASLECQKLAEGVGLFYEGLAQARKMMNPPSLSNFGWLEADLFALLQELSDGIAKHQWEYVTEILADEFPKNFKDWRELGLPELIRCRDQ